MDAKDKKSFFSILFVVALDNFGFGLAFILFGPLILDPGYHMLSSVDSHATRNIYLGLLYAVFPLTQLIGAPLLGDLADRFGRKRAFYISIIGTTLGYFYSGFSLLGHSYLQLLLSRLLTGFFAGNLTICMAAIADLSATEKQRAYNFGIMTVISGLCWPLAMITGGYLSDPAISKYFGPSLPFWIIVILSLLSLYVIARLFAETHPRREKIKIEIWQGVQHIFTAMKTPGVAPFFAVVLFWSVGWGLAVQWFPAYSISVFDETQQKISLSLIIQGLFWTVGGALVNPLLLRRFSTHQIGRIAFLLCPLILFPILFFKTFLMANLFFWVSAIFASFAFSSSLNLVSIHAPLNIQGKVMGLTQSVMSAGWVIVPIIGSILGALAPKLSYPVATFILFLGFLILILKHRDSA